MKQNNTLEIFCDASSTGWGAYSNGVTAHGFWTIEEQKHHINYLELKAALYSLKSFCKNNTNTNILLRIDNITAISCINRMGSVRFMNLNDITRQIWQFCEIKNLYIFATYIRSEHNVEADSASRLRSIDTEYKLSSTAFKRITDFLGTPEIDLFASYANAKCKTYFSWGPDPNSQGIDAFTANWKQYFFYAFPPFSVIPKTLQKIIKEKSKGIVVVPP